jgi:hypothetical protein
MFEKPGISYAVMALLLVLPQSIFVIGDYLAWGIRFPFFRWQDSSYGTSIIPLNREIMYVMSGQIGGRTAIATWIWLAGFLLLVAAAALVISWQFFGNRGHARYPGPLIVITGILFLAWGFVQYGPLLSGPGGYAIPVGVPVLWYCGWQFMRAGKAAAGGEEAPLTPSGS